MPDDDIRCNRTVVKLSIVAAVESSPEGNLEVSPASFDHLYKSGMDCRSPSQVIEMTCWMYNT